MEVDVMNAANTKAIRLSRKRRKSSSKMARYGTNTGTSGMVEPSSVLTKPPDEAIVTAVVVLKFATMISRPAEISSKPTGERIRAIERRVVIASYRRTDEEAR